MSNQDWRDGFKEGFEAGRKSKEAEQNPFDISKWKQEPIWPMTPPDFIPKAKEHCPKCGITLSGVMGYVCSSPNCPTGLGGATCAADYSAQTTGAGPSIADIKPISSFSVKSTNEQGYNTNWEFGSTKWHRENPIPRRHGEYDSDGKWHPDRSR